MVNQLAVNTISSFFFPNKDEQRGSSLYSLLKYFLLLLIIAPSLTFAQTTKVTGKVVDAVTREPLPFVNIIFKGTNVGVTTDVEGNYTISTPLKVDSIICSYIGYNKTTKAVKRGITQQLNLPMTQGIELKAIEVRPGENPA